MSGQSAEKDARSINGHEVTYEGHRFVCMICEARLLNMMRFQARECPGPRAQAPIVSDRCLNCNQTIRLINYALGETWMHVDPAASFPTEHKGTAWRHCRAAVATPHTTVTPPAEGREAQS